MQTGCGDDREQMRRELRALGSVHIQSDSGASWFLLIGEGCTGPTCVGIDIPSQNNKNLACTRSLGMVQPAYLIKMKSTVKKIIQETSVIFDNIRQ